MNISGTHIVKLAETFVNAPVFSLAFGAFAKLYEDEACLANYKAFVWSKLTEFCITLHTSQKNVNNLLAQADVGCTNQLSKILACIVCKAIYFHPIVLFCGHTFCRKCVDSRFNCQRCSTSSTSGEVNDCLLLTKAIRHFFSDVAFLYERLDELSSMIARGRYAEVLAELDELLEVYPNNNRCLQTKADVCLLNSDVSAALSVINKAMEVAHPVPKWFCLKARALKYLGQRRRALEYFFKCFTIFPYSDCLRSEITLILDEVITNTDVDQWKQMIEYCTTSSASIVDILSCLSDDLKAIIHIEPWMRLSPCPVVERSILPNDYGVSDYEPSTNSVEAIRDDFECALCLRIFLYPYSLPCAHTFCRECIEKSLDYKPECPLCKTLVFNYRSASNRGINVCVWKLVQLLFPTEVSERQKAYELEMVTFSRVGLDQTVELPIMLCCLAYPGMPCPLHIYEPQFRGMVRRAINSGSRRFGLFIPDYSGSQPSEIGTIVQITNSETLNDGRLLIDTKGCSRIRMLSHRVVDGLTTITFEFYRDSPINEQNREEYESLCANVHRLASDWLTTVPNQTQASLIPFFGPLPLPGSCVPEGDANGPESWVWWLVAVLPLAESCRYKLLSCHNPIERLNKLRFILTVLSSDHWKQYESHSCTGLPC